MKFLYIILFLLSVSTINARTIFVATDGNDDNTGTMESPLASLKKAQEKVNPGDTVYVRGGTYYLTEDDISYVVSDLFACITYLVKDGNLDHRINYWNYPGEQPVFDFSAIKPEGKRVVGIYVNADYLHIKGLEMTGIQVTITTHTESYCIYSRGGSHNIFENLLLHDNKGTGIRHYKGSDNLFLNCDAYRNHDDVSEDGKGGNTDGFGCHPAPGDVGNVFRGCRAWFNSDDGFDCIRADESITYENCQAFYNGYSPTFESLGDGNGFKTGGFAYDAADILPDTIPSHKVINCLTVRNKANGFYSNHHLNGNIWHNNTAYRNGVNFNMVNRESPESGNINVNGYNHILINNLSYSARVNETSYIDSTQNTLENNTFYNNEISVSKDDFVSLDESLIVLPRNEDGSIQETDFMRLKPTSKLIDTGKDIGLPFIGLAPDPGAFEYDGITSSGIPILKQRLIIYPNPAKDYINISGLDISTAIIINIEGKTFRLQTNKNKIDISNLPKGVYYLNVLSKDQMNLTGTFLKI